MAGVGGDYRTDMSHGPRLRYWPALVALIAGFLFSIVAFWAMLGWERATDLRRVEGRFEERAEHVILQVQQEVSGHLAAAEAVEALYEASVDVTRAEFQTFTRGVFRQNPHIRRIAWAPRVDPADREAFERRVEQEVPGFAVHPGDRALGELLFPIEFTSPAGDGELGLDIASVSALREAATHAAATGRGATVGPLPLGPLGGGDGVGVAVLLPFYRSAAPGVAPVLEGFVLELLDVESLVGGAVQDLDVWLSDAAGRPAMAWREGEPARPGVPPAEGLVRRAGLLVGDQVWTLAVSTPHVVAAPGASAWGVLALGLAASVVGAAYLGRLRSFAAELASANVALGAEMTRREEAERTRERLSGVLEATSDLVAMAEPGDHLLYLNRAGRTLLGIGEREEVGRTLLTDLFGPRTRPGVAAFLRSSESLWKGEVELRRRDGEEIPALGILQVHRGRGDVVEYRSAIAHDIRDRKQAERELERHAYYDELTGLPNRRLLERRLGEAIEKTGPRQRTAVLLVNPDRFRFVSLTLGPAYRDLALHALARRLEAITRPGETVAHYVGETFALILPSVEAAGVHRVRDALFEAVAQPLDVEGAEIRLGISIGGCYYPEDGADVPSLLRHADAALHEATELGGGVCRFFTAELHRRLEDRVTMEAELRQAIERDELTLYYQPQLDLETGRVAGVEALLRWRHPRLGLLGPKDLVKVAEASRLILPIGEWAMASACRQAHAWREAGMPALALGVNVSSHQLGQADLEARIRRGIREGGLAAGELEIELTESALMADPVEVRELLGRLRDSGCRIAIDDFGTGYSCLDYLRQLPVDRLKIDQSFVRDVTTDPRSAGIVRTILALARHIGLDTIAEGVSDAAQARFLRDEGCHQIQGYLVSRPVPADEIPGLERALRAQPLLTPA